jgi:sulfide:quinone oxidoreductase
MSKPHIVILGCNFAGLTTARYIHDAVKDKAEITIIDRKSLLTFVPNIPMQVLENKNPGIDMNYQFISFLEDDGSTFIQSAHHHCPSLYSFNRKIKSTFRR